MTDYEKMLDKAKQSDLTVYESYDFSGTRIKGLYCDGNIALSKDLHTEAEKKCILAEELGHHETTYGNIIDITDSSSRKQEQRARVWAYVELLPLKRLVDAYEHGCLNQFEIAEYLDITEEFLMETLAYYKAHYGTCTSFGKYLIYFEPLGMMKLLK